MTAKELDTMVNAMRGKYNKVDSRMSVTEPIYHLCKGLKAIGRNDLAKELDNLYAEIDSIDTEDIMEIGTFNED